MLDLFPPINRRFALVRFGQGVAEMVGSIGGTVFARNKGGAYARNRVHPINPNSPAQAFVRSTMNSLMQRWLKFVTLNQKAAWEVYAANVTVVNKLGATVNISSLNWYIGMNMQRKIAGLARVDDPPTSFSVGETDTSSSSIAAVATQNVAFTIDNLLSWAGEAGGFMNLYVGVPVNPTVNFFKGPFRHALTVLGDPVTAPVPVQAIPSPFPFVLGQKIFVRSVIGNADGRYGTEFITSSIAA